MITLGAIARPPVGPRIIASRYPGTTRTRYVCTGCGCAVDATTHKPGSEDCTRARDERDASRRL